MVIKVEFKQAVKESLLKQIEGVNKVVQKGNTYQLHTTGDMREALSALAMQQQWIILSMNKENESLEEVFQKLTNKNSQ
jgi:phosphotransferase system IIB component